MEIFRYLLLSVGAVDACTSGIFNTVYLRGELFFSGVQHAACVYFT